jgi:predicted TIM-barrel fold metal-dependent hydrolase
MARSNTIQVFRSDHRISRRLAIKGLGAAGLSAAVTSSFAAAAWDKPIDIHVHIEPHGDDFAPFGTVDEMIAQDYGPRLRYMDRHGIDRSVISTGYRYRRTEGIGNTRAMNDMIAGYVAKHTDRFPVGIGVVEVQHGEAALRELERIAKDLKLRGVGWHHVDGGVPIDHPFMRPILKQVQALKLIPFIHVREREYEAWWRLEVLAQEFPDMTFVALSGTVTTDDRTHGMHVARRCKNVLLDTGPAFYGGERALSDFVKEVGAERLLFGSNNQPTLTLQVVRNSDIPERDKQLILSGNTARLFGLKG